MASWLEKQFDQYVADQRDGSGSPVPGSHRIARHRRPLHFNIHMADLPTDHGVHDNGVLNSAETQSNEGFRVAQDDARVLMLEADIDGLDRSSVHIEVDNRNILHLSGFAEPVSFMEQAVGCVCRPPAGGRTQLQQQRSLSRFAGANAFHIREPSDYTLPSLDPSMAGVSQYVAIPGEGHVHRMFHLPSNVDISRVKVAPGGLGHVIIVLPREGRQNTTHAE